MAGDEAEKQVFFHKLEALLDSSDEDDVSNDNREILKYKKRRIPLPSSSTGSTSEMRRTSRPKQAPTIRRTTSAPISDTSTLVKIAPLPTSNSSLRQSGSSTPLALKPFIVEEGSPIPNRKRPIQKRTLSEPTPTVASADLILPYSLGIQSMLGVKRKAATAGQSKGKNKPRKEVSIRLVPEGQRIFNDCLFYYIPPDDISSLRKARITKAREYGVNWTKVLTPTTTHIVVEKTLAYNDVMSFLKLDSLPEGITMVNEDYPVDCISSRFLLNPNQQRYAITTRTSTNSKAEAQSPAEEADGSLQIKSTKSRPKKGDYVPPDQTPPRSQSRSQVGKLNHNTEKYVSSTSPIGIMEHPVEDAYAPYISSYNDELEEMIDIARGLEDMPLSDEEDELDQEDIRPSSRDQPEDSGSEDEIRRQPPRGTKRRNSMRNTTLNQNNFSCMTGGTGAVSESNPNIKTVEKLQQMADYYTRIKDHWRMTAYRRVVGQLKKQPVKIATYEQAIAVPFIGDRIAKKIVEIVLTNRLRRLDSALSDPNDIVLAKFMKIYNVGLRKGWEWIMQGYKTLEDLKLHAKLTDNQRIGIDHYDDFQTKIPRDEMTALGDIVKTNAAAIDPEIEVIIGGSYRRGALQSGDIDCLITKAGNSTTRELLPFLSLLIAQLTKTGFLVAALAVTSEHGSGSKWHGCCVLPKSPEPIWRRIDFLLVPETERGAALIYWTGDDIFNRSIRLLAGKKGWRLNQRGLYRDVMRGPGRVKVTEGSLIEGADERKIFAMLGVPWRPPEQRICH